MLVSRTYKPDDTAVVISHHVTVSSQDPVFIAGPCSVEKDTINAIAKAVQQNGAQVLRGGAFKPRTSPKDFQGLGAQGLELLKSVAKSLDMPVVSEIMSEEDISLFLELDIDVLQIGTRNAQNFALLKKVARTNKPILLKRGMGQTIDEFLGSAEYILQEGNFQVILCDRGIKSFERKTRNSLDILSFPLLKELTHLPLIADPSHAAGIASLVAPASLGCMASGATGLMLEVHTTPCNSVSDAKQAITPEEFGEIVKNSREIHALLHT